jgi:hypothetical protein
MLIDKALTKMSQQELWLMMEIPQSWVSYISNRKVIRRNAVLSATKKLIPIVDKVKGREDFKI